MKDYFCIEENFKDLISKIFDDNELTVESIPIGWTNIVQRILSRDICYIGRFPRDDFWFEALIHENKISNFVYDKVSTKISKLNLYQDDKNRIFTIHEEVPGISLSNLKAKNLLSNFDLKSIAEDIASFLTELHNIDITDSNLKLENIEVFLDRMLKHHGIDLEIPMKGQNSKVLIHGDFNPKNILLDKQNRLSGVIDFGFTSVGNIEWDLSRVCREFSEEFENDLINFYEQKSGRRVNRDRLKFLKKLWQDICQKYIEYMLKKNK